MLPVSSDFTQLPLRKDSSPVPTYAAKKLQYWISAIVAAYGDALLNTAKRHERGIFDALADLCAWTDPATTHRTTRDAAIHRIWRTSRHMLNFGIKVSISLWQPT